MAKEGYPIEWMQELKDKNDIVSTISRYIPLQQKGQRFWGCCPFHHEKTPSFAVNAQGGFYHCFGCHASGDVITFVKEMENVSFPDAVKLLAERAGMQVPEYKGNENSGLLKKKRDRLYEATKIAAKRYFDNLQDAAVGKKAKEYLANRGITQPLIIKFGIGYASSYDDTINLLRKNGFTDEEIIDSGVGVASEKRIYDALAGRVIVPIINSQDKVVAFGGRVLEKTADKAKYRNTGKSFLFEKGRNLFGVNLIKKQKQQTGISEIILVEGYMDVISMHKIGLYNVVASMGTALTKEQAKELVYITDKVYVCYDGDNAGQIANAKNMDILASVGLKPYAITLTDDMDPDDYSNKYGAEGFRKLLATALPIIDYKLKLAADAFDLNTPDGRAGYIVKALDIVKTLDNKAEQEVYLETLHSKSHVSMDTLKRQLAGEAIVTSTIKEKQPVEEHSNSLISSAEYVLNFLLENREFAKLQGLRKEWLINEVHQQIYDYLYDCSVSGKKPMASMLFDYIGSTPDMLSVINLTTDFDEKRDVAKMAKYYEDCLFNLKKAYAGEQIKQLSEEYENAVSEKRNEIANNIRNLQQLLRK